jgi:hypothetical protein
MTTTAEILELFAEAAQLGRRTGRVPDGMRRASGPTWQRRERRRRRRWLVSRRANQRRRDREVKEQWVAAMREVRAERRAYVLSLPPLEIRSGVCASCGVVVEHRPGVAWPVHLGQSASSRCRRA